MTQAERIIAVLHDALDDGVMGAYIRRNFYRFFVAVDRAVDHSFAFAQS